MYGPLLHKYHNALLYRIKHKLQIVILWIDIHGMRGNISTLLQSHYQTNNYKANWDLYNLTLTLMIMLF